MHTSSLIRQFVWNTRGTVTHKCEIWHVIWLQSRAEQITSQKKIQLFIYINHSLKSSFYCHHWTVSCTCLSWLKWNTVFLRIWLYIVSICAGHQMQSCWNEPRFGFIIMFQRSRVLAICPGTGLELFHLSGSNNISQHLWTPLTTQVTHFVAFGRPLLHGSGKPEIILTIPVGSKSVTFSCSDINISGCIGLWTRQRVTRMAGGCWNWVSVWDWTLTGLVVKEH